MLKRMVIIKTMLFVSLMLGSNLLMAVDKERIECLGMHYDAFVKDQLALFTIAGEVYNKNYPELFKVYEPMLKNAALNTKINQHVFHYLASTDAEKLDLSQYLPKSTPLGGDTKCNDACTSAMFEELMKIEQFQKLNDQSIDLEAQLAALKTHPERRNAMRKYNRVIKDGAVEAQYVQTRTHFDSLASELKCKEAGK